MKGLVLFLRNAPGVNVLMVVLGIFYTIASIVCFLNKNIGAGIYGLIWSVILLSVALWPSNKTKKK